MKVEHSHIPPGIMPVVVLQGGEYEMGFQYGQQVPEYIALNKEKAWAKSLRFSRDKRHPTLADRESVLHELKAWQHILQQNVPDVLHFIQGIADGATDSGYEVSYNDVLLINTGIRRNDDYHYPAGAEDVELGGKNTDSDCFTLAAWGSATKSNNLLFGDSVDGPWGAMVAIVAFPEKGHNYLTVCDAGETSSHPAMNDKGVVIGQAGGRRPGYPFFDVEPEERPVLTRDNDYGIGWRIAHKQLAQFSSSASEAVDTVMGWPIDVPENYCCTDIRGNGFNVEKTAAKGSVRKSGDFGETDFIYTGNGFFNAEMIPVEAEDKVEFVEHAGYGTRRKDQPVKGDYTISRNLMAWDMLHNYHGKIDEAFLKMVWRFPGSRHPVWKRTVIGRNDSVGNEHIVVGRPDDGNEGVANICTGSAIREVPPSGWSRGYKATHSFFKLTLPGTPADVVRKARSQVREDTRDAWQELMKLDYRDPGFGYLNDLYSDAMAEYYEGDYYRNKSAVETDRELLNFSKATTAYCRSQAHFRQIVNFLNPPAKAPEDLGLKPWGFWDTSSGFTEKVPTEETELD